MGGTKIVCGPTNTISPTYVKKQIEMSFSGTFRHRRKKNPHAIFAITTIIL